MLTCQAHLKVSSPPYLFKNGVKPNFTLSAPWNLQSKSVGFHSVSDECGVSGESCVFYDFYGLSRIRSTQPTVLKTPKLTPMVRLETRTISVNLRKNNRLRPRPGRFGFLTEPGFTQKP